MNCANSFNAENTIVEANAYMDRGTAFKLKVMSLTLAISQVFCVTGTLGLTDSVVMAPASNLGKISIIFIVYGSILCFVLYFSNVRKRTLEDDPQQESPRLTEILGENTLENPETMIRVPQVPVAPNPLAEPEERATRAWWLRL